MKKMVGWIAAIILSGIASSCIITDKFFPPPSSKKGSDIKADVESAAMVGYLLGYGAWLSENSAYPAGQAPLMNGAVVSGIVTRATSYIKNDDYYTASSADDCVSGVQAFATMVSYSQISSASTGVDSSCSVNSVTYSEYQNCLYVKIGATVGLNANGACNVKETGKVIHLSDTIKF